MAGSPRKHKPQNYSVTDFLDEFPDDEACLTYLWRQLHSTDGSHAECPKCERTRRFHRVASRQQLVERSVVHRCVAGSSPARGVAFSLLLA